MEVPEEIGCNIEILLQDDGVLSLGPLAEEGA